MYLFGPVEVFQVQATASLVRPVMHDKNNIQQEVTLLMQNITDLDRKNDKYF